MLSAERPHLPPAAERHAKVLRLQPHEAVELFDGHGRTRRFAWSDGVLSPVGEIAALPPPAAHISLFACVTKGNRWDWTIEKAVELGVNRIVPVISARSIVRIPKAERTAKAERWRRIAEDAARQSDAVWLPEILEAVDFQEALAIARKSGLVLAGALVSPPAPPILKALAAAQDAGTRGQDQKTYSVFVGPEGDFTPAELASLLEFATPVSFGPTILRAETAAIFAASVLSAYTA